MKKIDDYELENLECFIKFGYIRHPWFYVYIPKTPQIFIEAPVFDQKLTGEVWVQNPVEVQKIGVIFVIDKQPIGNMMKCKGINGKIKHVQPMAFDILKAAPDYIASVDVFKQSYQKIDTEKLK